MPDKLRGVLFSSFRALARRLLGTGLGRVPGVEPLYFRLYRALRPLGAVEIVQDGVRLAVSTADEVIAPALIIGTGYELFQRTLFVQLLNPGMVVADIGANNGYYAVLAARVVGAHGRIYAFEPEARNYELLLRSIALNGFGNVTAVRKAVSSTAGTGQLFLDPQNVGGPSLAQHNIPKQAGNELIELTTLDDFFAAAGCSPELLKMDIQGAEGVALSGAQSVLKHVSTLLMEFWPFGLRNMGTDPHALLQQLADANFSIQVIDERERRLSRMAPDEIVALCERKDRGRGFIDLLLTKRT